MKHWLRLTFLAAGLTALAVPAGCGDGSDKVVVRDGRGGEEIITLSIEPGVATKVVAQQQRYSAVATTEGGDELDVSRLVRWSSADEGIASIDRETGVATAHSPGTVAITATINQVVATAKLSVTQPGGSGAGGVGGAGGDGDAGGAPSETNTSGAGGEKSGGGAGGGRAGGGEGGEGGEAGAPLVAVSIIEHFNVGAQLCGLGFDSAAQRVWAQPCFGANVLSYSPEGVAGITITAPGEGADDVDVDFTPRAMTLGDELLSAQTALFFNGETDALDIYALDASGAIGTPSAKLSAVFGDSHVVGGSFHAERGTFFAVQDRVPGAALGNLVAELNPVSGAAINQFSLQPHFDVNYGDLEICQSTGHLFVVSSVEDVIAEFEPTGTAIAKYPAEVAQLSGIAVDDSTGEVWVASTAGDVWQLGGLPCPPFAP